MEITVNSAVCSKAGRDKGRFFAVLALEGEYALIADGMLRKLAKPKRKKLKHLAATTTVFAAEDIESDSKLCAAIKSRYARPRP